MNFGSTGTGTAHHLAGELFKILTEPNVQHVPYRGPDRRCRISSPATYRSCSTAGLVGGADPAGQLRALAVAAPKRVAASLNSQGGEAALPG